MKIETSQADYNRTGITIM